MVRSGVAERKFPEFFEFSSRILPRILLRIFPKFLRTFRASFRGRRRPEKIHQKSPAFFNAKFPGKHEKNIHKILLESRQSNFWIKTFISCYRTPGPRKGFRRVSEGVSEGSLKVLTAGFHRFQVFRGSSVLSDGVVLPPALSIEAGKELTCSGVAPCGRNSHGSTGALADRLDDDDEVQSPKLTDLHRPSREPRVPTFLGFPPFFSINHPQDLRSKRRPKGPEPPKN